MYSETNVLINNQKITINYIYYDRINVSESINVNKAGESKTVQYLPLLVFFR